MYIYIYMYTLFTKAHTFTLYRLPPAACSTAAIRINLQSLSSATCAHAPMLLDSVPWDSINDLTHYLETHEIHVVSILSVSYMLFYYIYIYIYISYYYICIRYIYIFIYIYIYIYKYSYLLRIVGYSILYTWYMYIYILYYIVLVYIHIKINK